MNDNFNTDLYQDWKMTSEKEEIISELENRVSKEKDMMPELLSRYDLKERWNMNSRQSVHNVIKRPDFPKPVYRFSNGRYPVYLKSLSSAKFCSCSVITPGWHTTLRSNSLKSRIWFM